MRHRIASPILVLLGAGVAVLGTVAAVTLHRWDARVTEQFQTHRWNFPSKIFAASGLVYPGIDLGSVGFFDRLQALGYRRVTAELEHKGDYTMDTAGGRIDVYLNDFAFPASEAAGHIVRFSVAGNIVTRIVDRTTGDELFTLELDPELIGGLYAGVWEERRLVTLNELPPLVIRAIIDVEDQRFYDHHGVDAAGVARALWINLRSGQVVQGGSTLTQQLMKNMFLSEERSMRRKLREALMALIVERRFSKQEILEAYVNEIYLGQRGSQGIFGVWEAANFYFAKRPQDLSVAEIAMLAGLIKAPNAYSPFRDPERARRRRDAALRVMREQGDITDEQLASALAEPLRVTAPAVQAKDAPYFVDFVRHELARTYSDDLLTSEGLQIYTALDLHLQKLAERAVRDGLADLEKRYPRLRADAPEEQLQVCLLCIQPQTGAIQAMIGGRDYQATQFNRCTQALRQPGSVFKPFTYLSAFESTRASKDPIRPTTRLDDEPFNWPYDGQVWQPTNYKERYLGTVTVRLALEQSLNAATARLGSTVGLDTIIDTAQRMGITSPLPPVPSVVLGAAEVTPLEVAQAFTVLANGGLRATPMSIRKVLDRGGQPIERNPAELAQAIPADTAYLVTHLLEGVLDSGTGRGARSRGFTRPAAGKTGTTNDYRDAWFAGFTPELVTIVWVGFDAKKTLNLSGSDAALPIWTDFMSHALAGLPATPFVSPPGITTVRIDATSGLLATTACPHTLDEAFYSGTEPHTTCPLHPVRIDPPTPAAPRPSLSESGAVPGSDSLPSTE